MPKPIICIAEKPSVAKEIARILGASKRHDGYMEGNGYCVTWTFGHLCQLEEPAFYNENWKHWNLSYLPMFPKKFETRLIGDQGIAKQFAIIKKLFENCSDVINCGDAGQEGELIQRWVMKQAGYEKPHKRLWISSLTDNAIRQGFKSLKTSEEFENLYHSGLVRAIGDWLLGINATRAYTLKFGGNQTLYSVGRVQTPTLALIVERHQEILNFKPTIYWKVFAEYRAVKFFHQQKKFSKQVKAEQVLGDISEHPIRIEKITQKDTKVNPPLLFDLTTLQVECNKKFGFSADKTLKLAQQLYEKKLITYPRVDTQYLSNDMFEKMPGILNNIHKHPVYKPFTQQISKPIKKSKRYFNDNKVTDHHAIIPTDQNGTAYGDESKLLDLIIRRFLCIFLAPAIESKTKVDATINNHKFSATGKFLKFPGWKEVYQLDDHQKTAKEQILPEFTRGESGPHQPGIEEKETKPPKKHTEATLLRAMETCGKAIDDEVLKEALKANGIGRPSTRASIIETLFSREYIFREKKNLMPTEKGISLIEAIQNQTLKSPVLTGEWENKLRQIEAGVFKGGRFLKELNDYVTLIIGEVKKAEGVPIQVDGMADCPKCKKGKIVEGKKAFGCSEWQLGCDFKIWKNICKKKISKSQAITLLSKGETDVIKGFISKKGNKFQAALQLQQDFTVGFNFDNPPKS